MKLPSIWEDEGVGPADTKDHVFLSRAFNQIGEQIFGSDDWSGKEGQQRHQPLDDYEAVQNGSDPREIGRPIRAKAQI